ncbi:hypothetical protein LQG66_18115 [Bradyrhizobium ontarionense]|uniref:Isopenicillin N synthase-like Fe(2+) 2OG dioxygenase domain-containing protein n=1 Tax=Bradyrhizobium ontarionense TaxID=2898149 RepID=A0ABY3RML3_9BRAD|nr:2OG-Fe(II) oxygenase family protein [Bradyrhizobium sp. A19]UFZ08085.1 hypothetical protein LQG66_18115 [Bradyrhizobium sp. A19]
MPSDVPISEECIDEIEREGFAILEVPDAFQELIKPAFEAGDRFFEADLTSKLRDRLPFDNGYRPYGTEYSASSSHPDEVESFTASYRIPSPKSKLSPLGNSLHMAMLPIFDSFERVAENIASRLAVRFGNYDNQTDLLGSFKKWSLLQFNYSRPSLTKADLINDLHEDGCLLTVMSIAEAGLELQSGSDFRPVTPSGRHILVMAGEIMWLMTAGAIRPAYHRVRKIEAYSSRRSILFFADMNPARCRPWRLSDINRSVNIGDRVLKNSKRFGLSEWISDQ